MTKLTGRGSFATQSANDDLIHIVDVSDTTQDPAGSSYKAKRSQIATQTFADNTARGVAVPGFIGQIGVQLDTGVIYRASGTGAGGWTVISGEYVVLLNQTGTAAPVATIIKNTLGVVPAWTRNAAGQYSVNLGPVFYCVPFYEPNNNYKVASSTQVTGTELQVSDDDFATLSDGLLVNHPFMIKTS